MVAGLQLELSEQIEIVMQTAAVKVDVVSVPPLYLTIHAYSMEDAQTVYSILSVRDDLRFYRVRSFLDNSYVLLYIVCKLGFT